MSSMESLPESQGTQEQTVQSYTSEEGVFDLAEQQDNTPEDWSARAEGYMRAHNDLTRAMGEDVEHIARVEQEVESSVAARKDEREALEGSLRGRLGRAVARVVHGVEVPESPNSMQDYTEKDFTDLEESHVPHRNHVQMRGLNDARAREDVTNNLDHYVDAAKKAAAEDGVEVKDE